MYKPTPFIFHDVEEVMCNVRYAELSDLAGYALVIRSLAGDRIGYVKSGIREPSTMEILKDLGVTRICRRVILEHLPSGITRQVHWPPSPKENPHRLMPIEIVGCLLMLMHTDYNAAANYLRQSVCPEEEPGIYSPPV